MTGRIPFLNGVRNRGRGEGAAELCRKGRGVTPSEILFVCGEPFLIGVRSADVLGAGEAIVDRMTTLL